MIRNLRIDGEYSSIHVRLFISCSFPIQCPSVVLCVVDTAKAYWWELPSLARRSVLVALNVALYNFSVGKFIAFSILHLATFIAHMRINPFRERADNTIEAVSLFTLFIVAGLLGLFTEDTQTAISVLLFVLCVCPMVFMAVVFVASRSAGAAAFLKSVKTLSSTFSPFIVH